MKLEVSVVLPFPRERVFNTYRDKLPDLSRYLPNVRSIQQLERNDAGNVAKMLNRWRGGGEVPAVARSFLSEDLLQWDDHATWDAAAWTCHWRTEVSAFKDAVRAEGLNTFEEVGPSSTRLTIRGDIEVDAMKVRGVPRLLAGGVGATIEKFLVATIRPNLVSVAEGLGKYLAENP